MTRITIVGPGAMGCLFAGLLAEAGHEVWLLDKDPERASRLSRDGIRVEGIGGSRTIPARATADPRDIGSPDLVFVWVKAYDTREAIRAAGSLLGPPARVLSLQNGWGNLEALSGAVDPSRLVGGVTSMGATRLGPGSVRHAGTGDTVIGRLDGTQDSELRSLSELLSGAGIPTRISPSVERAIWSKLIVNAAINPLTALTRLKNGELLEREETRALLDAVTAESTEIVLAGGISPLYPDMKARVREVCEATAANVSSMLQDVLHGGRTEVDAINGALVEKARALGMPAPVNEMLTGLVRALGPGIARVGP
jgi:2-dehydropantoate 2-reductase